MPKKRPPRQKTIRGDLHRIREVGFDLKETVGEFGKKYWRIRYPLDKDRSRGDNH